MTREKINFERIDKIAIGLSVVGLFFLLMEIVRSMFAFH